MVSVILPTYNERQNIRKIIPLIHETLSASGISHEIVVVDDDSPDGTAEEASRMADRFPVVVCRRVGERGLATAVLKGFGLSRGEIPIVFADPREGASGVLVDTVVLVSLVEFASVAPLAAAVFAFLFAVSWNYHWNSKWTFRGVARNKRAGGYLSFVAVCVAGLLVKVSVMHFLMEYAGMSERPWYVLASLCGILAATAFNFLGVRRLVFRESGLG